MFGSKQTILLNVDLGFVEDAGRPVIPFSLDVEDASGAAPHSHPRAQMIFASRGVMRVITRDNTWFVPPSQAVFVPPFVEHQVLLPEKVALRNLFFDRSIAHSLPTACLVFDVTPLLRELVLRFSGKVPDFSPDSADMRIVAVILDELCGVTASPMNLPMSHERRLARVMEDLLRVPGDPRGLEDWAKCAGASPRTLARLFRRETGLGFTEWRTQLRMLEALDRLSRGQSVTSVALDLGYGDASAFISSFRRKFGTTPGKYLG